METVGRYGGVKVSVCGNDEAIDFADLVPFQGKFRWEPTTRASNLSIRLFTVVNRPTKGGPLFRQPRLFSSRSTKCSTLAYSKTSAEMTRSSLPSVACHPSGDPSHPHLCFLGRSCAQAWPWRGSWCMRWRPWRRVYSLVERRSADSTCSTETRCGESSKLGYTSHRIALC